MSKTSTLALSLAALFVCAAHAQTTSNGRIAGKSYVNNYFHIAYTWPATLNPKILPPQPAGSGNSSAYAFPLFTASQSGQPYGVVLVAEKLNVAGPHSSGIKNSAEYIDRIQNTLRPGPILSNINRSQKKSAQGLVFDELNYLQSGRPSSVMATQIGQYLIVLKFNAQSAEDMTRMQSSAFALRKLQ